MSRFSLAEPAMALNDSGMHVDQPFGSDLSDFSETVGPVARPTRPKVQLVGNLSNISINKPTTSSVDRPKLLVPKLGQRKPAASTDGPSMTTKVDKRDRDYRQKDTAGPSCKERKTD
ncbi:hypothetical protein GGI09_003972 [Coemansia sp. S100]|nr:hypothetical protein GGI16_005209 [Coemansia sp. S142-1]KAJ2097171.1 hypothetical protein GGI09_003972 [Coemansia sp. S100]